MEKQKENESKSIKFIKEEQKEKRKTLMICSGWIAGCIVVLLLFGALFYQLIFRDFAIDVLLSTILALFSIVISIMFFFKTDTASDKFYDKVYEFNDTQKELLNKIDLIFTQKFEDVFRLLAELQQNMEKGRRYEEIKESADDPSEKQRINFKLGMNKKVNEELVRQLYDYICKYSNNTYKAWKTDLISSKYYTPVAKVPEISTLDFITSAFREEELVAALNTRQISIDTLTPKIKARLINDNLIEENGNLTEYGYRKFIDALPD